MKKSNKKIPKCFDGGKISQVEGKKVAKNVGSFYKNMGISTADATLGMLGLGNVIKDDAYEGTGSKFARGYSDVAGGVGRVALPMAMNMIAPGSGMAISAAQQGIGQFNPEDNTMVEYDQYGNPKPRVTQQIGNATGSMVSAAAPLLMQSGQSGSTNQARNGGSISKFPDGGKKARKVILNEDPSTIPQNVNPGGYNAFQTYISKKNLTGDTRMDSNEGRKILTDELIKEFNSSDYVKQFPKNAITPEAIKAIQSYTKLSDPNVQVDGWVGSETSQMRYPTPQLIYQAKSNDPKDPNYKMPINMTDSIQVKYGNKNYLLPAEKYKDFKRTDFIDPETRTSAFTYEFGGSHSQTNIMQVDGPSHEQGGVTVNSPNGMYEVEKQEVIQQTPTEDRILSDKIKVPGTRKTIAKAFEPFAKLSKIIDNTKLDPKLREAVKAKQDAMFEEHYNLQESIKQTKLQNYAKKLGIDTGNFKMGGSKQYGNGGENNKSQNRISKEKFIDNYYDEVFQNSLKSPKGPNADPILNTLNELRVKYKNLPDSVYDKVYNVILDGAQLMRKKYNLYKHEDFTDVREKENISEYANGGSNPYQEQGAIMTDEYGNQILSNNYYGSSNSPSVNRDINIDRTRNTEPGMDMSAFSGALSSTSGGTSPSPWANIAKQVGMGLVQNAGNIYDLKRANEVEQTTYNRMKPSLLDPTAALRYNDMQGRRLEQDLRNSSAGRSSTYIQNRKDASINQMMTNDQIRQQYANQNAQIQNQAGYYNAQVGDREFDANAMNRATSRNIKGNAYSNIGQNIMGQYTDTKRSNVDHDKIQLLSKYYNDPTFQKLVQDYEGKNK